MNFRSELGKSVNTDEAAALGKIIIIRNRVLTHVTIKKEIRGIYWYFFVSPVGAVYQAAELGKGFKVKKFVVKDANVYPIQVSQKTFLRLLSICQN